MDHPRHVFDEAFLVQMAAELSSQRNELDRLRRAVEAAEGNLSPRSNREQRHAAPEQPFRTTRSHRQALGQRSTAP